MLMHFSSPMVTQSNLEKTAVSDIAAVLGANRPSTEYDGFLRFTPTGTHCVWPRWSATSLSRNLAFVTTKRPEATR